MTCCFLILLRCTKFIKKNAAIDHDRCIEDDNDSISKSSKYNDV